MSKIKLISWNTNGIRTRVKNKEIDPIFDENPDIILFQETKAKYNQLDSDLKNIEDYFLYFSQGESTRSGGIATFSKIKPNLVKKFFDIPNSLLKMRVLNFSFDDFTLIHIYAPTGTGSNSNKETKLEFFTKLLEFSKEIVNENVIIAGDFNLIHDEKDISGSDKSSIATFSDEEKDLLNKLEEFGYIDTFRSLNPDEVAFSSWKSQKAKETGVGTRLDYFFVSKKLEGAIVESKILSEIGGSKHYPIELVLDI